MKLRIILTAAVALLTVACSNRESANKVEAASKPAEPTAVRVATAESRKISRAIAVTGSLSPDESVTVSSEVAGRLMEVHADFGQAVRKGQVLAELDKREISLRLERARAALAQALARVGLNPDQENATPDTTPQVRQALAQYEDAKFKYDNARQLIKTGDISQERFTELEKTFHTREAALQAARDDLRTQLANIAAMRAEVKLAEKDLSDATVRAPFDGAVTARMVSPGQYLAANAPIMTVVKTSPLRLLVDVPETAAAEVKPGSSLTFTTDAAPGAEFRAVVRHLNPSLDAKSRSLTLEARIARPDPRLRPGMFVQVQLGLARDAEAVMAPREAVYQIAGLSKVFVIRDGRALERKVNPGIELDGWVELPGGLVKPGERVAVSKLPMLTDGAEVRTEAR